MKSRIMIVACLCAALLLMTAGGAMAATTLLGPHDDGSGNPCKFCHDTASGNAALRGWASSFVPPPGSWAKNVSTLCYFCHDAGGGGLGANNMVDNAYGATSHSYLISITPEDPQGGAGDAVVNATGLPYTVAGGLELECTSCHNVHVETSRPFNQRASFQALCDDCHPGRAGNAGTQQAMPDMGGGYTYSTHPTQVQFQETGTANLQAAPNPIMAVNYGAAPGAYALGGHFNSADGTNSAGATMDCQTCHAVHGPVQGTGGTQRYLAIENSTPNTLGASDLCEGCHFGGDAGEQVGNAVVQATLPANQWSDHPIDANINRTFYPTGVQIPDGAHSPADWTSAGPTQDSGAEPFYANVGTNPPVCSSCHDMHGGIPSTPSLRGPSVDLTGATVWTFDYDEWCFVCHLSAEVIPDNHHSVINNLSLAAGDPMDSQLGCGDCHGSDGFVAWQAHNGFWQWDDTGNTVAATTPAIGNSNYCMACHDPDDPLAYNGGLKTGQAFASPLPTPAQHGVVRGVGAGSSHQTDTVPTLAAGSNYEGWTGGPDWSAWGTEAGAADQTAPGRTSEIGGGGEILCESCHNILFNGWMATQGPQLGWQANLLMAPYEDDGQGIGGDAAAANDFYTDTTPGAGMTDVDMCRVCHNRGTSVGDTFVHNPAAHTIDWATYDYSAALPPSTDPGVTPYGRTTTSVMTTPNDSTGGSCPEVSTADNATGAINAGQSGLAAPGFFSYPQDNAVNCDSCHRPHSADPLSLDVGGDRYLVLEYAGANQFWGTEPCLECHDTNEQCN